MPETKEEIAAYELRQAAYKRDEEVRAASALAWTKEQREEREARRITGMGFFRLVWIVVFGILIAQAIGGIVLWIAANATATR